MLWRCSEGHEWYQTISYRTIRKGICPICNKVNISNKLSEIKSIPKEGINDLETWCEHNGNYGMQLISEWTGVSDTGVTYSLNQVAKSSSKIFMWRCSEGHEWLASVSSRTVGRACPYCASVYVSEENSFYNWCINNGDFGVMLIKEWTGKSDKGYFIDIHDV